MIREQLAPAKVNLYLHVGPVQPDGYHPVESLMVFANVGDSVRLDLTVADFVVGGPFAGPLAAETENLVTRARAMLLAAFGGTAPGLRLDKRLPIAAGLGGGSSDAAAALRLLAAERGLPVDHSGLTEIARRLGADVPACLKAESVVGRGRGDDLSPAPWLPPLPAVLVNPGAPSPTGAVYRAYDVAPSPESLHAEAPARLDDPAAVAAWLGRTRNDLQKPAISLTPVIGEVFAEIAREPEALFTRMSGSGATVFTLCQTASEASALAQRLASRHPRWWVQPCELGVRN